MVAEPLLACTKTTKDSSFKEGQCSMRGSLIFEALETEIVKEREKRALQQGPEVAQVQQERAVQVAVADLQEEEEPDESQTQDDSATDGSEQPADGADEQEGSSPEGSDGASEEADPGADQSADAQEESVDSNEEQTGADEDKPDDKEKGSEKELEQAKEAFARFDPPSPSLEEFDYKAAVGDAAGAVGGMVSTGAVKAYEATGWVAKSLFVLGITYGPTVLAAIGKGVLFTIAKLSQGLYKMFSALAKAARNRQASVRVLSKDLNELKKILSETTPSQAVQGASTTERVYKNISVIDTIKIGTETTPAKTLLELNTFLSKAVSAMADATLTDLKALDRMAEIISHPSEKDVVSSLIVPMSRTGFHTGNLLGEPVQSYAVEELYYAKTLPGDMLFRALLPVSNLRTLDEYKEAYGQSELAMKFNKPKYRSVESVPVLNLSQLKETVALLDKTLEIMQSHEKYYAAISKAQPGVTATLKNYLLQMSRSKLKVNLEASMAEPMYLKAKFVSEVYLNGMMETHVYSARVFNAVMRYCQYSVQHLD